MQENAGHNMSMLGAKMMSHTPLGNSRIAGRSQIPAAYANHFGLINQMQHVDNDKLGELHMRLNKLLAIPLKKLKQGLKKGLSTVGNQDILSEGKAMWTVPTMILLYL